MAGPTEITGAILLGAEERHGTITFSAIDPATGASLLPAFAEADAAHVEVACARADAAFAPFSELTPAARANFLRCAAAQVMGLGDALIDRAASETGLPRPRLEGERTRTVKQLEFFAELVREGAWIDATVDSAQPQRLPAPRPDLRRRHIGVGPVVVFGASNFPLAFSVAGGDTAAALAAGCPVVVKGHPSHPGTGELVARAVQCGRRRSVAWACRGPFRTCPGRRMHWARRWSPIRASGRCGDLPVRARGDWRWRRSPPHAPKRLRCSPSCRSSIPSFFFRRRRAREGRNSGVRMRLP